jgi:F-type H+-transporting ATPase subunit b
VLPDITVLWVVVLIIVLAFILDRLVFRPVLGVIKKREEAVTSARLLAERATEEARQAGEEFERKTAAARAEVYRQMEEMRRAGLEERTALVEATRREAEQALVEARAQLHHDVEAARARLDQDADALATEAAGRILGRQPS